ncbi:MAG: ATP-binding protein [Bacillota bacterium]
MKNKSNSGEQLLDSPELIKYLKLITENMMDTIIVCDADLKYRYVSPAFEKLIGMQSEKVVGSGILENVHPEDVSRIMEVIAKALRMKTGASATYRLKAASGEYLWFESSGNPILDKEGNFTGAVIANREITERMKMEKEIASLDRFNLVGQMAAGIGHEIRNPMTTVRGLLQVLKNKQGCRDYEDYFNIMIEELDRANSIITEFLNIAKNKPVNLKPSNINTVIKLLSPLITADAMNLNKSVMLDLNDVPDLYMNEKEIRQLILNLVRNGLEAMEQGGRLTIKTVFDKDEVVLKVQDEGKGIEPELLDKIGTPFFTTKESGTGLGLAVCYGVAARHGASIDVKTGKSGTTFAVRFKAVPK